MTRHRFCPSHHITKSSPSSCILCGRLGSNPSVTAIGYHCLLQSKLGGADCSLAFASLPSELRRGGARQHRMVFKSEGRERRHARVRRDRSTCICDAERAKLNVLAIADPPLPLTARPLCASLHRHPATFVHCSSFRGPQQQGFSCTQVRFKAGNTYLSTLRVPSHTPPVQPHRRPGSPALATSEWRTGNLNRLPAV